ncbi:NUDIX domain-containing protein [Dyadobacter sediminis]|uniref:NUDIX domain-containing protein n=1 Tax=Dyadobacter sediminis TaxID=1493691 RepID=A0A5R9KKY6_9BACT|nr:NUDIX domain-containing protein [Dyadobacter sediminis]TLU96890.1 NUDIX domain-containing protein [Dyadobacter sediminis]GGB86005.1 NTP pyrophosphohydrolase [Dyadobacter sediminis]
MARQSAGILLYRISKETEVLLIHPGGPFFIKKDLGSWSIPKGEYTMDEEPLAAARREFQEETGFEINGNFIPLQPVRQKGGKVIQAWAVEGNLDADAVVSNTFVLNWPPGSRNFKTYPEVDRAEWFGLDAAQAKINERQAAFIDELESLLLNNR